MKKLTLAYRLLDQRLTPANIEGLKIAYETWIGCNQYNAEIMRIGTLAVLDLRVAANIKTTSAYDRTIVIDIQNGAVTMIAYSAAIGGHTHLAFEYMNDAGIYQHVVFHLVALKSGCDQDCKGTEAAVLKQISLGNSKYGFAGDVGGYRKATAKFKDKVFNEDDFKLLPIDNYERNLPNNVDWTKKNNEDKKYKAQTISVPTAVAKKGRLVCRKLSSGLDEEITRGIDTDGIESERFHRTKTKKGTNCVKFAMQVLRAIEIQPNWIMKLHAHTSPPRAIQFGKLRYVPSPT
ncbi:MAG: hypothetical protein RPU37_07115 [Candidatus Sedimenticola sp. (ex Thyasira tokunagai)]